MNHNIPLAVKSRLLTYRFLKNTYCQLIITKYMSNVIEC